LRSALSFLEASTQEYVVLCESNIIGDVDIAKLIGYYEDSGADMVVACKEGPSPLAAANRFSFTLAEDGRVVRACGTGEFNCTDHGIGIIVLKKTLLASLIGGRNYLSGETFREIISANIDSLKIYALRGSSPVLLPDTLESYFSACMKFLEPSFRKELFVPQRPVYTKVMDEMPALYGLDCKVSHSLIADGCKVFGSAENSILFRDVRIEKGAHVKNCVIMQGCTIGEGAKLENVILDKNVSVSANARIAPAGIEYFAKYSNF
jgi:glucose-1-phosphate adenylyltransferase